MPKKSPPQKDKYQRQYSEQKFWEKIKGALWSAGREVTEKAFILYYVGIDPKTPNWAKTVIGSALGYFILPIDAIPDFTPVVGFADDLGVIVAALASLGACINKTHIREAKQKTREYFG